MSLIRKIEKLPVGATATCVGLGTLANVWFAQGFDAVRYITMVGITLVWIAAMIKLFFFNKALREDYVNVVPGSLYATYSMLTMIVGSFIVDFNFQLGRGIWLFGVILHIIHILIFTYLNVLKGIKINTFLPSWFVTYMGFLVSTVVGTPMGMDALRSAILTYGLIMYCVIFTAMVIRTIAKPYPEQFKLTFAIFFAPTSLLFVSYLNVAAEPLTWVVFTLYGIILATIVAVAIKLPGFLRNGFTPGHAALTFPPAIALVASFRMSQFLHGIGMETLGEIVFDIFSVQKYITTAILAFVAYGFLRMFKGSFQVKEKVASTKMAKE